MSPKEKKCKLIELNWDRQADLPATSQRARCINVPAEDTEHPARREESQTQAEMEFGKRVKTSRKEKVPDRSRIGNWKGIPVKHIEYQ